MTRIKKMLEEKMKEIKLTTFWLWFLGVYCALFLIDVLWLSKYSVSMMFFDIEWKWNWGFAVFLVQLFYVFISFRIVGPTELGVRLFFGKPISEVSSGLVFIPFGICQLQKETRLTIQDELPADPQHIWREPKGKEGGEVPKGYFPPIRIPFGFPKTEEELKKLDIIFPAETKKGEKEEKKELDIPPKDDALNVRVTAEVVPIIRWRIIDYIGFLTTIGSRDEARKQMEDCAVGSLMREFAKVTPAVALANLGTYSYNLSKEIIARIDGWGINLESAQIKSIVFHRDLNEAIAEVPQSTLKAKAIVISAEAKKKETQLFGEGKGIAEKAILDCRAAGFKNMAKGLNVSAQIVIGAETARAITENPGQKTIVAGSGGFADLLSVAAVLGDTLKKGGEVE